MSGGEPLAADLGAHAEELATAFTGMTERRELGFEYGGRKRRVLPYGLAHRRGHWYLVAPESAEPARVKVFRLDRALGLTLGETAGAFDRPPEFRAASFFEDMPWERGPSEVTANVVFDEEVAWIAERELSDRSDVTRLAGGGIEAQIPVAAVEPFIGWLITFDDRAEVIGPPELRSRFLDRVRGVA